MIEIPTEFPLVGSLSWTDDRDRGYEALILCGPVVIVSIALFGRSLLTTTLAAGYILSFVVYLLWMGYSS